MLRYSAISGSLLALSVLAGCASAPKPAPLAPSANPVASVKAVPAAQPTVQVGSNMLAKSRTANNENVRYVVKKGDTLWDISAYFLADPWLWPEIWHINPEIANPNLIYPGEIITLVWVNGKPMLMRGDLTRDVRLSPRVRTTDLGQPIPAIPLEAVRHFLTGARFITPAELAASPYVLASADKHLISARGMEFYATRFNQAFEEDYIIVHPGQIYTDPVTGEVLGQEGINVGEAKVLIEADTATLRVTETLREVVPGDRLFPVPPSEFVDDIFLQIPKQRIEARVAAHFDIHLQAGNYDVVTINVGTHHGVKNGTVFEIFKHAGFTKDPVTGETVSLPEEYSGVVVVFRTESNVAHALVMKSTRQININDLLRSP